MLVYTLDFIFSNINLLSPVEFFSIIFILYFLLYISAPYPDHGWQDHVTRQPRESIVLIIQDAWFGEIALWRAFWPYFLILNAGLYAADSLAKGAMLSVSSWDNVLVMSVSSSIIWCVAVWRTSANTGSRVWGAFARLTTLCVFFDFALRILVRAYYPSEFFNCQELLLSYTNCFSISD